MDAAQVTVRGHVQFRHWCGVLYRCHVQMADAPGEGLCIVSAEGSLEAMQFREEEAILEARKRKFE